MPTAEAPRRWAWPLLGGVLAVGLLLRVWGIRQGLPYAYNADEADHFVPRAVGMFEHGLNPHYFANPPAYTYVLHFLFSIAYGGKHGVLRTFALHPASVYTLSRATAAALGVLAVWLTYLAGARLVGRTGGLLAAAIEAVAFLPVHYSHVAVNDVPTLAPLTLSLVGTAGVLRKGRTRDCLLAGAGLGVACASKYTAGVALAPLIAAIAARYLSGEADAARRAVRNIAVAAAASLCAFVLANPYALLDYSSFHQGVIRQSTLSAESQGKLGAPRHGGLPYYLWSLTWGLGWAPALAALGGAVTVRRREPALGWLLVPAPLLFLIFMGLQGRYFGRWLMPILPIMCLLAAVFVLQVASGLARLTGPVRAVVRGLRRGGQRAAGLASAPAARSRFAYVAVATALTAGLLAQGLIYGIHAGAVLSRADTRNLTRAWLVAHVPAGTPIVAEPVSPDEWARQTRPGTAISQEPYRWKKYPSLESRITPTGALRPYGVALVTIENYERTLSPALIGFYERNGYCWVVSGSTQSGRAFADPAAVPEAVAYYHALARRAEVVYRVSPFGRGAHPVAFGFDWSFNYYPLAYHRPGPAMTVYRLRAGRCGG